MLADEHAAFVDEAESRVLFSCFMLPAAREGYVHSDGGANGFCTEIERGVTGDNFCVGECADVAHFCLICGDFSALDHFVELQACGDACEVSAFIDGSKRIEVVAEFCGVSLCAGCVEETHARVFFCRSHNVIFVSERIREDDVAALFYEFNCGIVAFFGFWDTCFDNELILSQTEFVHRFFHCIDEVLVISGLFVVQADETDFDVFFRDRFEVYNSFLFRVASDQTDNQSGYESQAKHKCKYFLFHTFLLLFAVRRIVIVYIHAVLAQIASVSENYVSVVVHTVDESEALNVYALFSQSVAAALKTFLDCDRAAHERCARLLD